LASRRGAVLHQENASVTHVRSDSPETRELVRGVLLHPPYCLDRAPNDYHLFSRIAKLLSDKKLGPREDWGKPITRCFANKSQDIYERGTYEVYL
ncbi:hypothetical protein TNCV_2530121, partial [Trichonephila clavipes]